MFYTKKERLWKIDRKVYENMLLNVIPVKQEKMQLSVGTPCLLRLVFK